MSAINDPAVVAEVKAAFADYERALVTNDVPTLVAFFWADLRAIRYGDAENLYGHAAIAEYRARHPGTGLNRTLEHTVITTYGEDFATASTLFHRPTAPGSIGRQMQTWVRMPDGWRIVAAHVSQMDAAPP